MENKSEVVLKSTEMVKLLVVGSKSESALWGLPW